MSLRLNGPSTRASAKFITPPFVVAVVLLLIAAALAGPVAAWRQLKTVKLPLPLKRPLAALEVEALAPYHVVQRLHLEPEIVESLGTERYISWRLEDESLTAEDPLRYAHLIVTYYSGGADLVPHIAEVCYLAAGYEAAQIHENTELEIATLPLPAKAVPIRVSTFVKTAVFDRDRHTVLYTFFCNGRFVCTRTAVRLLINDPTKTHAFFSKVEVRFDRATREQSIGGARKLLERVLPVLVTDHWPDFEAAEQTADD